MGRMLYLTDPEVPRCMECDPQLQISLAAARVNAGLSQQELGSMMGVSRFTIGRWEHNYSGMTVDQICRFSELTRVPIGNLRLFDSEQGDD